jgi:hypothetical protein
MHSWVISIINRAFTTEAAFCASMTFTSAVDMAVDCKELDLLMSVESARIQHKDIPAVPAIFVTDKHNLYTLRDIACYVRLQEALELQTVMDGGDRDIATVLQWAAS